MKGIIYKATNTFNGKVYIGQTIAGLPKRKSQHYKDAKSDSDNIFHVALYQYPNAFEWETIDTFTGTKEEVIHSLNVAEEYHILKCNSTDERYGYNATYGGYSSDKFAEHIKRRAREHSRASKAILQYDVDGNFVREFSSLNEVAAFLNRDKVSPSDIITGLHYNSQWRLKKNEYYPKFIGEYKAKNNEIKTTPIIAYNSDGTLLKRFATSTDAEKVTGVSKEKILNWSKGKTPSNVIVRERDKKPFYFFRDADDYPGLIDVIVVEKKRDERNNGKDYRKRVAAYSLDGDFIAEYDSIVNASEQTGVSESTIRHYCQKELPIVIHPNFRGNHLWRYVSGVAEKKIDIVDFHPEKVEIMAWRPTPDGHKQLVPVTVTKKQAEKYKKKMEHRIIQYSISGEFIKVWDNAYQAAESGADSRAIISKVLAGKETKKTPNYQWRHYYEIYPQSIGEYKKGSTDIAMRKKDVIEELSWDGTVIATYNGTSEAAEKSGCSQAYVCNVLAGKIKHPKHRFRRVG